MEILPAQAVRTLAYKYTRFSGGTSRDAHSLQLYDTDTYRGTGLV